MVCRESFTLNWNKSRTNNKGIKRSWKFEF